MFGRKRILPDWLLLNWRRWRCWCRCWVYRCSRDLYHRRWVCGPVPIWNAIYGTRHWSWPVPATLRIPADWHLPGSSPDDRQTLCPLEPPWKHYHRIIITTCTTPPFNYSVIVTKNCYKWIKMAINCIWFLNSTSVRNQIKSSVIYY